MLAPPVIYSRRTLLPRFPAAIIHAPCAVFLSSPPPFSASPRAVFLSTRFPAAPVIYSRGVLSYLFYVLPLRPLAPRFDFPAFARFIPYSRGALCVRRFRCAYALARCFRAALSISLQPLRIAAFPLLLIYIRTRQRSVPFGTLLVSGAKRAASVLFMPLFRHCTF